MKKKIIAVLSLLLCVTSSSYADEWVNSWITQSTISTPGTFQTQKRGYVTTSNMSVRYKSENDHMVSFSPPSFKKGCGGIDVFFGSMNYLNAERLMAKFERIMSGALATYAFDLALNVLCTSCSKELQTLESLMDRLNALQIDDCQSTKAVVAVMNDKTGQGESAENTEAMSDFMINSGITELYNDATDESNNMDAETVMADKGFSKADMVSGCPAELTQTYFTPGSLFENIAILKGIPAANVRIMRGLIGDVLISNDLEYAVVDACPQNSPVSLDKMIYGEIYSRDGDSACVMAGDINIDGTNYTSLSDWANINIMSVIDALEADTAFTAAQIDFFNSIPQPIYIQLVTDVNMWGGELDASAKDTIVKKYTRSVGIGYAEKMFHALFSDMIMNLQHLSTVSTNQAANNAMCASALKRKAESHAKTMIDGTYHLSSTFQNEYNGMYLEEIAKLLRANEIKKNVEGSKENSL